MVTTPQKLGKLHPPFTEPAGDGLYDDAGLPNDDGLYDPMTKAGADRWTPLFYPPPLPPPRGLYDVVTWVQNGVTPLRFLEGLQVRQSNVGLDAQFGVWGEDWCADPDSITGSKQRNRPDAVTADFEAITVYGWDANQCGDLTGDSRAEVRARATQVLALTEQNAAETSLASRLLSDAPTPVAAATITEAVSALEVDLAKAGVSAVLHASPKWAAHTVESRTNVNGRSPMGHTWVFGGGYADTLGDTIVATTALYGWRGPVSVRDATTYELNQYSAVAERSLLIAYEAAVAAAKVG